VGDDQNLAVVVQWIVRTSGVGKLRMLVRGFTVGFRGRRDGGAWEIKRVSWKAALFSGDGKTAGIRN